MAQILAKAAFYENKAPLYIPNFGVEQRGGVSLAFLVINDCPACYPKFEKADILAILANRSVARVQRYVGPRTIIILGPAVKNGLKTNLPSKVWNIFVLGKINREAKIVRLSTLKIALNERFTHVFAKDALIKKLDLEALDEAGEK